MVAKTKAPVGSKAFNVTIFGRHVQVTDAMKQYAADKLSKIDRVSDRIIDVAVTMDIQKLDHRVDIKMRVNNYKIKVSAVTTDMYASINEAVHKLDQQLRRYKHRLQDRHALPLEEVDMQVNVIKRPMDALVDDVNDQIDEENRRREEIYQSVHHEVVAREKRALKTLTLDEAVVKMELSGDVFLIFRDEANRDLKVIYRRKDGNYGIIELR